MKAKLLASTMAGALMVGSPFASADKLPDMAISPYIQHYVTQTTKELHATEYDFNSTKPAGRAQVLMLDYDQIVTFYNSPVGPQNFETAIRDYVKARTGQTPDRQTLADLSEAMSKLSHQAYLNAPESVLNSPKKMENNICYVVPYYAGHSFETSYHDSFKIIDKDTHITRDMLTGKEIALGIGTNLYSGFVNNHEAWHCMDTHYLKDLAHAPDQRSRIGALHRREVFADIGGILETLKEGAHISLIDRVIDLRNTWNYTMGPEKMKQHDADEDSRYEGAIYNTVPALQALKRYLLDLPAGELEKMDRKEMLRLAEGITDTRALSETQLFDLAGYYEKGEAYFTGLSKKTSVGSDAANLARYDVMPMIEQMKASAQKVIIAPVPPFQPQGEPNKSIFTNADVTQTAITEEEKRLRREHDNKASRFTTELEARQIVTDKMREALNNRAAPEPELEKTLDKVFLSPTQNRPKGF